MANKEKLLEKNNFEDFMKQNKVSQRTPRITKLHKEKDAAYYWFFNCLIYRNMQIVIHVICFICGKLKFNYLPFLIYIRKFFLKII